MKCHYHPDRDSVNNCAICGKPICSECGMEVGGNILCKDCVNSLISDSLTSKVSEKINQTKNESNKDQNISEQPQTT
ncbi:MAG: ATPase, partial [Methanobrevibacter wolinii]